MTYIILFAGEQVGISSTGIGSGLDVESIITKLMAAESAPLTTYDDKTSAAQAKVTALGTLGTALTSFQSSLKALSSPDTFKAVAASVIDSTVMGATATSSAAAGSYKISVTQLAQAQSLNAAGQASTTAKIGSGGTTTLTFQFGTVTGGNFGVAGSGLPAAAATDGIANGALTINGTAIATSSATKSPALLAEAINAQSATTGVTANVKTSTAASLFAGFGNVVAADGGSYALNVNGINLAQAGDGAADIDTKLASTDTAAALAAAKITFTGTAAAGNLQFFTADGSSIDVTETVGGDVTGGIGKTAGVPNAGSSTSASAGLTLVSTAGSPITVGGTAPAAAGLTAGTSGSYLGTSFAQDGAQASGTVVLKDSDQSLQGIRDAINNAKIGVSASIVSDGSGSPYRLVLTSTSTGASSTMKISVSGEDGAEPNAALTNLLAYDPAGTQKMSQTTAAQSTLMNVNGIAVTSAKTSVSDAIEGVTLNLSKIGSTSVTVSKDSTAVKAGVTAFVNAYNALNKTIKSLTSYDAETKAAGVLIGDSTVRSIETQLNQQLGVAVAGSAGTLNTLSQIGISRDKTGNLVIDSTKLQKALDTSLDSVGGVFAAVGKASDASIAFTGSTAATKPGTYDVEITQIATRGAVTGAKAFDASTMTTVAANTKWSITLDQTDPVTSSRTQSIAIPAGTYNSTELTAMLRATINGNAAFASAGLSVDASVKDGVLSLSSSRYGKESNITLDYVSGSTVASMFGTAATKTGLNVEGKIAGIVATGSGQTLTGADGADSEGLKLTVTSETIGNYGTVSFSQGYAYQLNALAAGFLGDEGLITNKTDGIKVTIKGIATAKTSFSTRLEAIEKQYRAQFTALDVSLASMQATSSYLTQQLAAIAANA
jgi:flagellar hook-associated protein 2